MGGYVKITFEDIEIAKNFFENEKHLDEFLVNICKYYCGYENVFKYKNVKKFFETYKKTMDRVILGRSTGSIGGKKRVENQQDTTKTLEGVLEGGVKDPLQPKERKEINLIKEIKEIKFNPTNFLLENMAESDLIKQWFSVRKIKKLANTEIALKDFIIEVNKSKMDINDVLRKCIISSWGGFKYSWILNENNKNQPQQNQIHQQKQPQKLLEPTEQEKQEFRRQNGLL